MSCSDRKVTVNSLKAGFHTKPKHFMLDTLPVDLFYISTSVVITFVISG